MSLRFAQVIHTYPNYRTCEVAMVDNGQRFQNVTFLHDFVSSNSGVWISHGMLRPASEEEAGGLMSDETLIRSVLAACVMMGGRPYIVGFQPHPKTQLAFIKEEQNRDIYRHPAGTLVTVNKAGNFELQHTGAMYLRIASEKQGDPIPHEDLTPLCANKNWLLPLNDPPTLTLSNNRFRLVQQPSGDVEILSDGNWTQTFRQDGTVTFGGDSTTRIVGDTTRSTGGDVKDRALGDETLTAAGDSKVLTLGGGAHCAANRMLVGSLTELVLEAPVIRLLGGVIQLEAGMLTISAGATQIGTGAFNVSAGEVGLAAAAMVLSAPGILANTNLFTVSGEAVALGAGFTGGIGAGTGGGGPEGLVAAEIAVATQEIAAASADMGTAQADIAAAVQTTIATSDPARGTGLPDNEGEGGEPAPDVP